MGRVLEHWNGRAYRTPRYYVPGRSFIIGEEHEYRIRVDWFLDLSDNPIPFEEVYRCIGSTPSTTLKKIGKRAKIERMIEEWRGAQSFLPEEVAKPSLYVEGASRRVSINAYERNPIARLQCIDHYGPTCVVCGFRFDMVYGSMAKGFIHVHHIKPLSEIGEEYEVDPVADLRPVCANCHAIIHLGGECRSIDEARRLVDPRVLAFWATFCEQSATAAVLRD